MNRKLLFLLIITFISINSFSQARLTIVNNSFREMEVKVMRGTDKGSLFKTVYISPNSSQTVYFRTSGSYFTKSKATLRGKDPIYKKGNPFRVTNNEQGYSVLTLTFTIKESAFPESSGETISRTEFEQN